MGWDGGRERGRELTGVWSISSQLLLPLRASSRGRKSLFLWFASSLLTQPKATSMVRCMMLLSLSSSLLTARLVVFSMSRRTVVLDAARGIKTVLMHALIKCIIWIAGRRLGRYERSGSFLTASCEIAKSLALARRISKADQGAVLCCYLRIQGRFDINFTHIRQQ